MTRAYHVADTDRVPPECYGSLTRWTGVSVFHSRGWHRVLNEAFGWQVRARTIADGDGQLLGFLPYVRKRRLGRRIDVCLPLSHRVGVAGAPELPLSSIDLTGPDRPLEIHSDQPLPRTRPVVHHTVSEIDLRSHGTEDDLLMAFQSDVRRRLRKSVEAGVTSSARSDVDAFEAFAELQSLTRRRQGSPTYPRGFFRLMGEELGPEETAVVHLVQLDGRPVAGTVFFRSGDTAMYAYGGSIPDRDMWRLGVNQVALSDGILAAWRQGLVTVDLGSSPLGQPDLRRYKEHFGATSRDLVHRVAAADDSEMSVSQDGLLAGIGGAVLRHTPLPIFRRLSPWLLKAVV